VRAGGHGHLRSTDHKDLNHKGHQGHEGSKKSAVGSARFTFTVKVHPRAKVEGLTGMSADALKLSVKEPASEGRANAACIKFFADLFAVPRSSVTIAAGAKSRTKVVRVTGISEAEASRLLKTFLDRQ
jgi:uncharacterized protein